MYSAHDHLVHLANEQLARHMRHASEVRLAEEARRRHRPSLRLRFAAALIGLGERLAAEHATASVRPA